MSLSVYLAFLLASAVVMVVPGLAVTLIVANSLRHGRRAGMAGATPREPRGGFFVQGLAVALSNPKTLLFFGAFFPQFIAPSRDFTLQVLVMGTTAMVLAAISDSAYALLVSRAGAALSRRRLRLMTWASGALLIGGGLWLALSRSK